MDPYSVIAIIGIIFIILGSIYSMKKGEKKKPTYTFFLIGGVSLLIYSISIDDLIFIILQIVFIITSVIEIILVHKSTKRKVKKR